MRIALIDGQELTRHMVDHQIGVEAKGTFTVYRLDEDFFEQLELGDRGDASPPRAC